MKKNIVTTIAALALTAMVGATGVACGTGNTDGGNKPDPNAPHSHSYSEGICSCGKYEAKFLTSLPMAQSLQAECDQKGSVVDFTYDTYAYAYTAEGDEPIAVQKTAQVYLPYGYTATKKYNVLYLMHGGGETYEYWLTKMGETTTNVLDNMIKDGKCEPTIVVCPTVHTTLPEGSEAEAVMADTAAFPQEFRNELIGAVETEYSTYLGDDASAANIAATRDHRGFAGFSMGSITSFEVIFQASDLVSYVGSFSAGRIAEEGKKPCQDLLDLYNGKFKNSRLKYWFNMNGTSDFALDSHEKLNASIMTDATDLFQNGKNYAWILVKGGSHAYNCWIMGMYNCLLVFYK